MTRAGDLLPVTAGSAPNLNYTPSHAATATPVSHDRGAIGVTRFDCPDADITIEGSLAVAPPPPLARTARPCRPTWMPGGFPSMMP